MSRPRSAAVRLVGGLAWVAAAAAGASSATAQENPMLGSWTAVDPATGIREVLTVTPEAITFGAAAPPIPYRVVPAGEGPAAEAEGGDALSLYLADGEQPARFTFFDDANAQLSVPGGPTIALERKVAPAVADDPESTGQAGSVRGTGAQAGVIDAAVATLLPPDRIGPYGPDYDPLHPTLIGLLAGGWEIDEVNGSTTALTLLMTNGGHHALCRLIPRKLGGSDAAVTDCRRLN